MNKSFKTAAGVRSTIYSAFAVYRKKLDDSHIATFFDHDVLPGDNPLTPDEYVARVRATADQEWDTAMHGERSEYTFSFGGCKTSVIWFD